jgi:hypothetical protein
MKIGKFNIPVNSVVASARGDIVYFGGSAELGLTPPTWVARPIGTNGQTCKVGLTDSYTNLLCHFDTAKSGATSVAATGQTLTYVGTADYSTVDKKFGAGSLLLDGNSDYVTVPDSADWNFGTGNFTIDLWVKMGANGVQQGILSQWTSGVYFTLCLRDTNKLQLYYETGGNYRQVDTDAAFIADTTTWHHIAVVRNGSNTYYMFLDGVSKALTSSGTLTTLPDVGSVLRIGNETEGNAYFNGYIDELRISKGIARWTSGFDVPTKAYTAGLGPTWVT